LGVQVSRTGTLFFLGALRPEDKGVLVRRCRRLTGDQLREAVDVLRGQYGRVIAYPDGLVVVGDTVEVLQRVAELLDKIEAAETATWVVQLYLVSLAEKELRQLGLDLKPAVDVSATFAAASQGLTVGTPHVATHLAGGLGAVLKAARARSSGAIVAEPLFLLGDGGKASFVRGDRVPIPQQTVSAQGTNSTSGYSYVQTGLELSVAVREVGARSANVTLEASISTITGYVGLAPIVSQEAFKGAPTVMESGGVYLCGSLRRQDKQSTWQTALQLYKGRDETDQVIQVWCRCFRIGEPVVQASAAGDPGEPASSPISGVTVKDGVVEFHTKGVNNVGDKGRPGVGVD